MSRMNDMLDVESGLSLENSVLRRQLKALAAAGEQQRREAERIRDQRDKEASVRRSVEVELATLRSTVVAQGELQHQNKDLLSQLREREAEVTVLSDTVRKYQHEVDELGCRTRTAEVEAARAAADRERAASALRAGAEAARTLAKEMLPSHQVAQLSSRHGAHVKPGEVGIGALADGLLLALQVCGDVLRAKDEGLAALRQEVKAEVVKAAAEAKHMRRRAELGQESAKLNEMEFRRENERTERVAEEERHMYEREQQEVVERMRHAESAVGRADLIAADARREATAALSDRDRLQSEFEAASEQLSAARGKALEAERTAESERRGRLLAEERLRCLQKHVRQLSLAGMTELPDASTIQGEELDCSHLPRTGPPVAPAARPHPSEPSRTRTR
eukprot:Hpha_TRINITY_DN9080_c0_g1::TRINITY_DN9080_c0_g1_i1::g.142006::m.142006